VVSSGGSGGRSHSPSKESHVPQRAWSNKRERQYDHIKRGLLDRGAARAKSVEGRSKTSKAELERAVGR
jgi:hypothetical protein